MVEPLIVRLIEVTASMGARVTFVYFAGYAERRDGQARRMRRNAPAPQTSFDAIRAGSLRRRILEYIADQGGELRSDCGQGLRRRVCDALGERPTPVSQALLALEKAGMLEREMDLERHRCHAIRLVSRRPAPPQATDHQRSEFEAAQRELDDAIRRAADAASRVAELRWALARAVH
jgi:DNA-binding MarR family transcriptional regulator